MTSPLVLAKRDIGGLLSDLNRNRSRFGEYDWEILVPDVADALRRAAEEDTLLDEEILTSVARTITRDWFRTASPSAPADSSQLALFYVPDAPLTLGERQVIAMSEAKAIHLEKHRAVLTDNFHAQSNSYFAWMGYIDDRIPRLRESGDSLGEIEYRLGEGLS